MRAKFARNNFHSVASRYWSCDGDRSHDDWTPLLGKDDAEGGIEARAAEIADQRISRIQLQPYVMVPAYTK
jgi:hypothetical protein